MNDDYSHIVFIMDRSGSMWAQAADAIGGFNSFVNSQKALPGKATMSLILFDHEYLKPYDFLPIEKVEELTPATFVPRGSTALRDAVGRAINETGAHLASLPENERPGRVLVSIITDGRENASSEFSAQEIKDMIEHQQTKYSWQITFLSSDISASEQALSYGFSPGNTRSAKSIASALNGYTLSARNSRTSTREAYLSSSVNAFDMPDVNDALQNLAANVAPGSSNTP